MSALSQYKPEFRPTENIVWNLKQSSLNGQLKRRSSALARGQLIKDAGLVQFSGVLPPDAPNPRDTAEARVANLEFPVLGLVEQPAIEDLGMVGVGGARDAHGESHVKVSISYTLWRNPDDHSDPVNLADLDDQTRTALEAQPPWPRPVWLMERVEQMRFPQLWEAVQTSWHRESTEFTTVPRQLVEHTNYVLMNQFRDELGLPPGPPTRTGWKVSESAVTSATTLEIDGTAFEAHEIDTDPLVYAVGARLNDAVVTTLVVAREHLPHLRVALVTRNAPTRRPNN